MNNFDNIPMISQPINLKVNLFPHQLASVYRMEKIENEKKIILGNNSFVKTKIAINADITGYGKTLTMVALILRNSMKWNVDETYVCKDSKEYASGLIIRYDVSFFQKINVTLILADKSIVNQWIKEFSHTPLKVFAVTSNGDVHININQYDVIIVVPRLFNGLIEQYPEVIWKRFIFDEPGNIRVPAMRTIKAGFIWLITATPDSITYTHRNCRTSFMYDIIGHKRYDINSIGLQNVTIKNPDEFVRQSFKMPQTFHKYYYCYSMLYKTLNGIVSSRILDMINANDIDSVIKTLGGTQTSNIIKLIKNIKKNEIKIIKSQIDICKLQSQNVRIKKLEDKIKRIENQILQIDSRFSDILSQTCSICCENFTNPVLEPKCQNIFCAHCLFTWLQTNLNCPLCRSDINTKDLVHITDNVNRQQEAQTILTKENTISNIIKENPNGKFIIYSSVDETFKPIKNTLNLHNINFSEIKGNLKFITKILDEFKNGKLKVLFLNSRYNGAGLNLVEATDLIIYHKMSEDTLTQILGRPNRIGRVKPLQVHHLLYQK